MPLVATASPRETIRKPSSWREGGVQTSGGGIEGGNSAMMEDGGSVNEVDEAITDFFLLLILPLMGGLGAEI